MTEQSTGVIYYEASIFLYGGWNTSSGGSPSFINCHERSGPTGDSYCCNGSANNNPDPANYADKPSGWWSLQMGGSIQGSISVSDWRTTECHPCSGGNTLNNFADWMAGIGNTYSTNIQSSAASFLNNFGEGGYQGSGWNPILPHQNHGDCGNYNSSNICVGSACQYCWHGLFTNLQACNSAIDNGDWSGFGGQAYTVGSNSSNPYYGCLDTLASNFIGSSTQNPGIVSDPSMCEYELYRCGDCNTPCTPFVVQNNPGLCQYDNTADCIQGCDSQTADSERWTCMGPDKFGNQQGCRLCTQYEIDNAMPNINGIQGTPYGCRAQGGHATQQDCENHPSTSISTSAASDWNGCAGPKKIKQSKEPSIDLISPLKSDPQIDRMQKIANIKK